MGEFKEREAARVKRKDEELAPFIEAAFKRKSYMAPLADDEIAPVIALGRQVAEQPPAKASPCPPIPTAKPGPALSPARPTRFRVILTAHHPKKSLPPRWGKGWEWGCGSAARRKVKVGAERASPALVIASTPTPTLPHRGDIEGGGSDSAPTSTAPMPARRRRRGGQRSRLAKRQEVGRGSALASALATI